MKYCVTGGAGFIGSHIVKRLLSDGHQVVVLDDFSNSSPDNVPDEAALVEGSILEKENLKQALENCDGVFHLAAEVSVPKSMENPQQTLMVNAMGTLRLLMVMKEMGVNNLVYSGTSAVYGDRGQVENHEDMLPQTLSPYAYSKLQGEYFVKTYSHLYGIKSTLLRYFNVFGPGQRPDSPYAAVIPIFLDRMARGENLKIFGDGSQTRDFIFIDDVVEANLKAMNSQLNGEVVNIGSGNTFSLLELIQTLGSVTGKAIEYDLKAPREGDILHSSAKVSKAKAVLGFEAQVSLEMGLKQLISPAS